MFSVKSAYSILTLTILLTFTQLATCLECYTCISKMEGDCGDNFDEDHSYTMTCSPKQRSCYITIINNDFFDLVTRGCTRSQDKCENTFYEACSTCTTDLCNSSSYLTPLFSITLISLSSLILTGNLLK